MERERSSNRRRRVASKDVAKPQTLPSSPSNHHHHHHHSSSSSDFEFITISTNTSSSSSLSPHHHKSSNFSSNLCPADELFYKGQLLPLHLSPRLSIINQTLLLSSSSTSSSSDTNTTNTNTTTTSRDSNSSNDSNSSFTAANLFLLGEPESARPSSVTEEDRETHLKFNQNYQNLNQIKKPTKNYFSKFSSVFRRNKNVVENQENLQGGSSSSVKRMSNSAKEVIRKYLKKVKPLYEKLSQKQNRMMSSMAMMNSGILSQRKELDRGLSQSFSDNLRYPKRRNCVSSCPSSMRSSPTRNLYNSDTSSMEELQSAIQGAIAHCKNSMNQKKTTLVSN